MSFVHVERHGSTLEITLSRPPANTITPEVGTELHAAYCYLRDDPELRVGILRGAGERIFCAGWDLKEVAQGDDPASVNDAVMDKPPRRLCGHHGVLGPIQAGDRRRERRRRGRRVRDRARS